MQRYSAASCGVLYVDSILHTAMFSIYINEPSRVLYIDRCTLQCPNIECFTWITIPYDVPLYTPLYPKMFLIYTPLYLTMFLIYITRYNRRCSLLIHRYNLRCSLYIHRYILLIPNIERFTPGCTLYKPLHPATHPSAT